MSEPDFFVPVGSLLSLTLAELPERLDSVSRKRVGNVEIGELARLRESPNGVYLFWSSNGGDLQYVGKATSRSFIDRIPAHFDPREDAWMNSLPKHIRNLEGVTLHDAVDLALDFQLTVIGVDSSVDGGQLENVLRGFLRPRLNQTRRELDPSLTLAQACGAT